MAAGMQSFEEAFTALEQAVQRLEAGNQPLEMMLDLYEQAMQLAKHCQTILAQAELRVRQIEAATATDEDFDLVGELDAPDEVPF